MIKGVFAAVNYLCKCLLVNLIHLWTVPEALLGVSLVQVYCTCSCNCIFICSVHLNLLPGFAYQNTFKIWTSLGGKVITVRFIVRLRICAAWLLLILSEFLMEFVYQADQSRFMSLYIFLIYNLFKSSDSSARNKIM